MVGHVVGHGAVLPEWLSRRAYLTPGATAVIASGKTWSFAELDAAAAAAASSLASAGVRPGDHVAILAGNSADYVVVLCALMGLGAVAIPLNTRLAPSEIAWQLSDSDAVALLHDERHAALAREALAGLSQHPEPREPGRPADASRASPSPLLIPLEAVARTPGAAAAASAAPPRSSRRAAVGLDETQGIIYTSGTTGRPKGALLTYGNHWWSAIGSGLNLGGHAGDVWLLSVPLFHVSGLSIVMRSLIHGFAILLHERFDPAAANEAIDGQGVTILSVVATMLGRMIEERGERPYPPRLRAVLAGGGPVPEPMLRAAFALGMPVLQTYGLTETASQAATLAPQDALRKLGSAGKPLFPTEIRIDAPPGEVGEILVRGPSVSPGYYRRPEESAAVRKDGWLRTGDLGYYDDEGYLYVLDRRTDLIISGGENVYPAEVESVLKSHPAVVEAGVAARPDARWGQVPVAFVVARQAPSERLAAELIQHCAARLARYKVPAEVRFVDELPRNATGKLARRLLRDWLEQPLNPAAARDGQAAGDP